MKSFKEALPYVLLVSYLALSHFKQPEIADSIIIIALSALCGYRIYTDSKEQPNYMELFGAELAKHNDKLKDLETRVGIYNIAQQNKEKTKNTIW